MDITLVGRESKFYIGELEKRSSVCFPAIPPPCSMTYRKNHTKDISIA